jgi:hypothetical protein
LRQGEEVLAFARAFGLLAAGLSSQRVVLREDQVSGILDILAQYTDEVVMTGAVPREQQTIDERQILRQIVLAPCTVPAEDAFERCPPL